jgi:hypothetical protein
MDQVLSQAPPNISDDIIKNIFIKNKENVVDTLTELWNIVEVTKNREITKWDEIRETCDAFDVEMNNVMKQIKLNQQRRQQEEQIKEEEQTET